MRINDIMEEAELDEKVMMVGDKPKTIREIIKDLKEKNKKKRFAEG